MNLFNGNTLRDDVSVHEKSSNSLKGANGQNRQAESEKEDHEMRQGQIAH